MDIKAAVALSLSLAACSESRPVPAPGDGGPTQRDAGSTSPIALDDLPSAATSALCGALFRCTLTDPDLILARVFLVDVATCEARLGLTASGRLGEKIRDAEAGRTTYNPAAAASCIAAYASSCVYLSTDIDVAELCAPAFSGAGAMGASCRFSHECDPTLYCAGSECPGTCQPRKAWGAECSSDGQCPSPTEAGALAACNGVCEQLTLSPAAPSPENGPCGLEAVATLGVRRWASCAAGLACGEDQRCVRPLAVGATCRRASDVCAGDALCDADTTPASCRAVTRSDSGADCGGTARAFCDLSKGLYCDEALGKCTVNTGAVGSACSNDLPARVTGCGSGLYCAEGRTCQPKKDVGEACFRRDDCVSGVCSQVCVERGCGVEPS